MQIHDILTIVSILATVTVGWILSTKIKAQKDIIEQYKTYLESVDLKKIKEFHNLELESIVSSVQLEMNKEFSKMYRQFGIQFDEMATYISEQMEAFGPEGKELILNNHLRHCRDLFEEEKQEE